jgi:hypothetical protein
MDAPLGFEPRSADSKSVILPLDEGARICSVSSISFIINSLYAFAYIKCLYAKAYFIWCVGLGSNQHSQSGRFTISWALHCPAYTLYGTSEGIRTPITLGPKPSDFTVCPQRLNFNGREYKPQPQEGLRHSGIRCQSKPMLPLTSIHILSVNLSDCPT